MLAVKFAENIQKMSLVKIAENMRMKRKLISIIFHLAQ